MRWVHWVRPLQSKHAPWMRHGLPPRGWRYSHRRHSGSTAGISADPRWLMTGRMAARVGSGAKPRPRTTSRNARATRRPPVPTPGSRRRGSCRWRRADGSAAPALGLGSRAPGSATAGRRGCCERDARRPSNATNVRGQFVGQAFGAGGGAWRVRQGPWWWGTTPTATRHMFVRRSTSASKADQCHHHHHHQHTCGSQAAATAAPMCQRAPHNAAQNSGTTTPPHFKK